MPTPRLSTALRLLTLSLGLFMLSSAIQAQSPAVRIMPLGDSITGSPGCWRALLWDRLQRAGITNIDFVGTQPPQGCSIPYDGDNEGHGGALATSVADQNQLPAWLAATHPDIVLMHFGTNDIWSGRSPTVILAAFSKLVDQMRASNPNMILLVAQIIPVNPSTCADCAQRTIEFNAAIPAWASGKSTAESPIIVVDQWTGFNSATDTSEGVHPNAAGEQKIADKWFPVLSTLLLGQPPAPGFSLSATPRTLTIASGTSGISTIGINRFAGFVGSVTLRAVAPAGWTVSFSPTPATGTTSVMTVAVPAGAPTGVVPLTVTGIGGQISSTTTVSVTVSAPPVPSFTLTGSQASQTVERGSSVTNTITVDRSNGFTGAVELSAAGLPAGVTAAFSSNPVTGTSSVLTLTASATAVAGTSNILVTGVGTPGTRTVPIALTVSAPATLPCASPTMISLPFARDGVGEFCFVTSGTINFINSWNTQLIEINGVPFTNKWADNLPPRINGNYVIHYVATLPSAHFEATGTSGPVTTLTVAPTALSVGSAAATTTIAITSNTNWTVTDDQSWITATPVSGANNGMLTISVAANPGTASRSGTVTVTGGSVSRTVTVTQSGVGSPATPCANPIPITLPFTQNGAGEFCWVTSGTITFINSWNTQLLEINGVPFTNLWANNLPPRINGNYYIHFVATVPYAHFEINGTP